MKKIILTLSVLIPFCLNAQWKILNEGFESYIRTIDFVDEYTGWMAGENGTLLVTSDGGESWSYIPFPENLNIRHIDFINCSTGWALGEGDVQGTWTNFIWKTTDGGFDWNEQFSTKDYGLNSIFAVDDQNCFAAGGNRIFRTTNGGATWLNVVPLKAVEYYSVWFRDPQNGFASGIYSGEPARGKILKTTDGGSSWEEKFLDGYRGIYDLQFTDSAGYFRTNNDSVSFLCRTTDSGENWNIIAQSRYGIPSYHIANDGSIYAVMSDSISSNNIMKSTDGGVSWQLFQKLNMNFFFTTKIYFYNSSAGFLLGSVNCDCPNYPPSYLLTYKEGQQWEFKRLSYPLNDVYFNTQSKVFIFGGACAGVHPSPNGMIFSSTNTGKTWYAEVDTRNPFRSTFFVDQNVGYSIASMQCRFIGSEIYKTTDSGNSWDKVYEDNYDSTEFAFDGNEICFMNEQIGWAVGERVMLGTTDSGEHWELVWYDSTIGNPGLKSISFNDTTGLAVGYGGLIVKYTPQSGWVKQSSVTDLPLNKVYFMDDNHGWIAGGYQNNNGFQTILLKTTDGGISWNTVPNVLYLINDIEFVDNSLGWAVGYDSSGVGGILKSTDGGNTWTIDTGNLSAKLNSLHIKEGYGWAVGEYGLILRTTNAGPTWMENENQTLPTEFVLEQNYPNPFNPSTIFKYSIPNQSKVIIKVFDILGNHLETLVNEEKSQGSYEINWKATKLPSGVYFYQLKAGEFVSTKKMILLK